MWAALNKTLGNLKIIGWMTAWWDLPLETKLDLLTGDDPFMRYKRNKTLSNNATLYKWYLYARYIYMNEWMYELVQDLYDNKIVRLLRQGWAGPKGSGPISLYERWVKHYRDKALQTNQRWGKAQKSNHWRG